MIRSTVTRIGRITTVAGLGLLAVLGSTTAAHAAQSGGGLLQPGVETCTAEQYAGYEVRGTGTATGQLPQGGAKFKLKLNGAVVQNTPSRVNNVQFYRAAQFGNFQAGYYSLCATNTGNAPTSVTLDLRTDGNR